MRRTILLGLLAPFLAGSLALAQNPPCGLDYEQMQESVNVWLQERGEDYRLVHIQPMFAGSSDEQRIAARGGGTFHSIKAPNYDFVPRDPRRPGDYGPRTDITVAIDRADPAPGYSPEESTSLLRSALSVYDDETCSDVVFTVFDGLEADLGVLQAYWSEGASGSLTSWADLTYAGYLPHTFFDHLNQHPTCGHLLGITATYAFQDEVTGQGTDLDHNGMLDVKFRESYFRADADWMAFDLFTVALHETGHLLGTQHMGWVLSDDEIVPKKTWDEDYIVYHGIHDGLETNERSDFCKSWRRWPEEWVPLDVP